MHQQPVYLESRFEQWTRLIGLFVLGPLLAVLALPVAIHIALSPDPGFSVRSLEVVSLTPGGAAAQAGLRLDDRILAVGHRSITSMAEFYAATAADYDHSPWVLTIDHQGQVRDVTVTPRPPTRAKMIRSYSVWLAGLSFLAIGYWVLLRRRDPVARNFFGLCMIFAFILQGIPELPFVTFMIAKGLLGDLLNFMLPAFFLRFFLQFPSPRLSSKGEPPRYRILLLPGWLLFIAILLVFAFHPAPTGSTTIHWLEILSLVYTLSYFLAGLIIFARRTMRKDRPIQRTKMQVLLAGLLFGLLPFLIAMLVAAFSDRPDVAEWQFLGFSLMLVPASFGLAIMRYGALDKAFVVRVSLVYAALTGLLVLAYFVIVVVLGHFLKQVFGISTTPLMLVIVAFSSVAILPLRHSVQKLIDSTFYPERQINRKAIAELTDELSGMISPDEVVATLLNRLNKLFRPASLALFLLKPDSRDAYQGHFLEPGRDGPRRVARTLAGHGEENPLPSSLAKTSSLVVWLDRLRRPIFAEELEDIFFSGEVDPDSLTLLTRLQASLLVPLVTGNNLLAFLALGHKRAESLFSQDDLANLRTLATQAASVLEGRRLYEEVLSQQRLETELELARDIQASMLPTGPLDHAGCLIAGHNEPCLMVGGDYFDFFPLDDHRMGFAIADVAGKGIPAALQMTSLRVVFRREAEAGSPAAQVIKSLNFYLAPQVRPGQFVCFFYGIWDNQTNLLTYSNAGMELPVLFRPGTGFHQFLKVGGPVLGVSEEFPYREGALALHPGDHLLLYTDGITEQANEQDEFFDSDRLVELVQTNLDQHPVRLLETIFSTVKAFGGPEKSDDKTAIIMEINQLR